MYSINNGQTQVAGEIKKSDFIQLIDMLRTEVSITEELSQQILNVSRNLKSVPLPETKEDPNKPSDDQSVLGIMWAFANRIANTNARLNFTYHHLTEVVGL